MAQFPRQSLSRFFNQVSTFFQSNGLIGGLSTLRMLNEVAVGSLIGIDSVGNKYYENQAYMTGRTRWVVYADKDNFDASSVPAEW
jgi:NADH:ubiquinone oxidoreductase subunit